MKAFMWIYMKYMIEECFSWYVSRLTHNYWLLETPTLLLHNGIPQMEARICKGKILLRPSDDRTRAMPAHHYTLENERLEPESHLSEKENHLPNLHDIGFHVNFQGVFGISGWFFLHLLHKFICQWFSFELPVTYLIQGMSFQRLQLRLDRSFGSKAFPGSHFSHKNGQLQNVEVSISCLRFSKKKKRAHDLGVTSFPFHFLQVHPNQHQERKTRVFRYKITGDSRKVWDSF